VLRGPCAVGAEHGLARAGRLTTTSACNLGSKSQFVAHFGHFDPIEAEKRRFYRGLIDFFFKKQCLKSLKLTMTSVCVSVSVSVSH
jgi:hypothetical protein